jgi:hypothetical protein
MSIESELMRGKVKVYCRSTTCPYNSAHGAPRALDGYCTAEVISLSALNHGSAPSCDKFPRERAIKNQ